MKTVGKNMVVSFRYKMMNESGQTLEDTTSHVPTRYLHGSTAIAATLQDQMEGMKSGGQREISLQTPGGLYRFIIYVDSIRDATENEIILGYPVAGIGAICDDDCECFHPEKHENTFVERLPG